jgi:hypothetical protein
MPGPHAPSRPGLAAIFAMTKETVMADTAGAGQRPGPGSPSDAAGHSLLAFVRAQADRAELAEAAAQATAAARRGSHPDHPAATLAARIARNLVEAGFTLHHCQAHDPLSRLGGVCLQVAEARDDTPAGVAVTWTTHSALLLDDARWITYYAIQQIMNAALGAVLTVSGQHPHPFGTGGAWLVPVARETGDVTLGTSHHARSSGSAARREFRCPPALTHHLPRLMLDAETRAEGPLWTST